MRSCLNNIIQRLGGSVLALYLVAGMVLVVWGDGHKAYVRSLTRMGVMDWNNYPIHERQGASSDRQNIRLAIRYYKTLLLAFPSLDQGYDMLGYCYFHLNDLKRSERSYQMAARLSPASFWHDYNLGLLYYREGAWDKAQACFLRVLDVPFEDVPLRGVYAPLAKMDPRSRAEFFKQGRSFALMVRERSWMMAVWTYATMKKNDEARALARKALLDPLVTNKGFFFLYSVAVDRSWQGPPLEDQLPIFHPWAFQIPVGKESYY